MPYHTIAQGETLFALAAANGLKSWKEILDAPENAELKKIRPDPGILLPGDRVFIPNRVLKQAPSAIDATHTFKVATPKAWLRLAIRDADGTALAGKKYELTVEGKTFSGTVAAGGIVEHAVGVAARNGTLKVWTSASEVEEWTLKIGAMDPIDALSGVQARLNNLGFDCGEADGIDDDETKEGVRAFQARIGLEPTGVVDDTLRRKLLAYYDAAAVEAEQDAAES